MVWLETAIPTPKRLRNAHRAIVWKYPSAIAGLCWPIIINAVSRTAFRNQLRIAPTGKRIRASGNRRLPRQNHRYAARKSVIITMPSIPAHSGAMITLKCGTAIEWRSQLTTGCCPSAFSIAAAAQIEELYIADDTIGMVDIAGMKSRRRGAATSPAATPPWNAPGLALYHSRQTSSGINASANVAIAPAASSIRTSAQAATDSVEANDAGFR